MSKIGQRIKIFREMKEMTQSELAKELGLGRAAINKYENGSIENIPLKTIERMADVFGIAPQVLVGWGNEYDEIPFDVRVFQAIKYLWGQPAVEVVEQFQKLDRSGQRKVIQYATDMTKLRPKSGE